MGNLSSIRVHPNAPSPSTPGAKSAVSDPLDGVVDYDTFLDELLDILKDPAFPGEEGLLKSKELTEVGPEEFEIKVTLDGLKLDSAGWGHGCGKDVVRLWQRIVYSRDVRLIQADDYDEDGDLRGRCFTKFSREPFQMECWYDTHDGHRKSDVLVADIMQQFYINPIIYTLGNRKTRVYVDAPSIAVAGLNSVVSDCLDIYLTYDELYYGIMDELMESNKAIGGTCQKLSETEFTLTGPSKPRVSSNDQGISGMSCDRYRTTTQLVRHRPDKGEIIIVSSFGGMDGKLMNTTWNMVHWRPLRLEAWIEDGLERRSGKCLAMRMQAFLDKIIGRFDTSWPV